MDMTGRFIIIESKCFALLSDIFFYVTKDACACNTVFDVTHHLIGQLLVLLEGSVERDPLWDFDIYFTEVGAALRTVLPVLFKYCYKYCYSHIRKL